MSAAAPFELEGLRLGAATADVIAQCAARGWGHNLTPASTLGSVLVDPPVDTALCTFDRGALAQIQITYQGAQPARVREVIGRLAGVVEVELIASWGGLTADRRVACYGDLAGTTVTCVDVAGLSNRAEVARIFATYGGGAPPPA